MSDLTIANTDLRVLLDSWTRKPSIYQGGRARMADNSMVSTETAEKRVYECRIDWYDATEESEFRATVLRGVAVFVSGDLPGTGFDALVDIGETQVLDIGAVDFLRSTTLHIEEI